ncbi:NUDIX hydrolase domain-like protein [Phascolomyces articulosus]|uniref:NUDIX hydrolase domain-like protein n=1 Tax=Phascolomyces articulosus TaxID=60185 RepID=A0AAD5K1X8_9FUNG|nr:NUDIX hydrolase domain-like protein [Phascolomyces articulosus]
MQALRTLIQQLQAHRPLHIDSPAEQPRRAAVCAIFRCRSTQQQPIPSNAQPPTSIKDFLDQPWVNESEPELLFIQRATRATDRWSGHVAFPGGKNEAEETDEQTAERETLEEIGLDLNSSAFLPVGTLDAREITNMKGELMMILVPHVYIQVVPETPPLTIQESEVAVVQWVPLRFFLSPSPYPDSPLRKSFMIGNVSFPAIELPTDNENHHLQLWGLTLGMTRELIELTDTPGSDGRPIWQQFVTMARGYPRFSHKDMNVLIRFFMYIQPPKRKQDRERVYMTSLRRAIYVAVLWRIIVGGVVVGGLTSKLLRLKKYI